MTQGVSVEVEDWQSMGPIAPLYRELKSLDLLENIAELDAFGFTVVPPEKVGDAAFHERMRAALDGVIEWRFGAPQANGSSWRDANQIFRLILWEDEAFESLVLNPAGLGLVQYLLGPNCILSLCDGWIKGPGEARTPIHQDNWDFSRKANAPEPNSANFNYLLTDYSADDGAISFVPGSHKWRRPPTPADIKYWDDRAHPIEAPAGSMVIWGDLTWHGSFPRRVTGERLMILGTFNRPFMQTQEPFRQTVTDAALRRNPIRFAGLMDAYGAFPFGKDDIDAERLAVNVNSGMTETTKYRSLFDTEPAGDAVSRRPDYAYDEFDRDRWEAGKTARLERSEQRTKTADV